MTTSIPDEAGLAPPSPPRDRRAGTDPSGAVRTAPPVARTAPDLVALARDEGTWLRDVRWWDRGFYAIVALTLATFAVDGISARTLLAAAPIVVVLVAYVSIGRRAARTRDQRLAVLYLVIAVAGTTAAAIVDSLAFTFLFAVFSQIWMLIERRWVGVLLCVAMSSSLVLTEAARVGGFSTAAFREVAPQAAAVLVFSIGLGLWIAHTVDQGQRYRDLAEAMQEVQGELADSHHAAGVSAERERVAREIHDTLAQGFTSIVMLAQVAQTDLDQGRTDSARGRLDLVEATARESLAEARALVAASAPAPLQAGTLAEALGRAAVRFEEESGVAVHADWRDVPPLDAATEVVLLRVVQESLANVRRHAGAARVRIVLAPVAGEIHLEVTDDGRGIPAGTPEGFGTRAMRERVLAHGGRIEVTSGDTGRGTRVAVHLPGTSRGAAPVGRSAP